MSVLSTGGRVTHPEHGPGEVTSVLRGGRAAMVRFAKLGKLEIHVSARELLPLDAAPEAPAPACPSP